jgi:CheY-like chemotaxis protein
LASLAIPFVGWFYTKSCDDYVPKPFSPCQLLAKIRQY